MEKADECKCGSGKESKVCCADCGCGSGKTAKECCSAEESKT